VVFLVCVACVVLRIKDTYFPKPDEQIGIVVNVDCVFCEVVSEGLCVI